MTKYILLLLVVLVFSCQSNKEPTSRKIPTNLYAHGFEIIKKGSVTKLTVTNPWERAHNISIDYFLLNKGNPIPDSLKNENIIYTPVEKVICLSTSHVAFIDALGEVDKIVGVSGSNYISNEKVAGKIKEGKVVDVGYGQSLNYELVVQQKADLVMVYGIGSEVSALVRKLNDLGVPAIMNAEYLEENPLGKAEWIKFVGSLFQKEKEADTFFANIEKEYLQLKTLVKGQSQKPNVMVGSPYKDAWWVPGGNSYMANLINDAGGAYLGKNNDSHESFVISFENAFSWATNADVWINMGPMKSKKEILAADSRFKSLDVFHNGRVFNNINRISEKGGNDFWESGTIYPNLILKDLIKVFYPEMLVEEGFTFYKEIK